ncbi:MAG: riboflavin synthase [Candidatus Moranbacteria bacterium]|nr:riboflavin synthase [Candidatus Moranbacteria bacterium]
MFTGIIKKVSTVENVSYKNESLFVAIKKPKGWKIQLGQSIAINGVCSTVKKISKDDFEVEYMPETIAKTTVENYAKGSLVNLETSMTLNDLLDGHIVQGHVDTRGKIMEVKKVKESVVLKIKIPAKFMKFIADKGSVAIDGISLTIANTGKDWLTVSLVSFTLENTNLGSVKIGDSVNIETDVLAKYLFKLLDRSGLTRS